MPPKARPLGPLDIKRMTKPGTFAVGGVNGLYIVVSESGARSWVLRYHAGGKRHELGLGPWPEVSLAKARERAAEMRDLLWQGRDPLAEKRAAQAALKAARARPRTLTFREAAYRCHKAREAAFRNPKHRKDWISSLERYAFPTLGNLPVDAIDTPLVMAVLEPIWRGKTETATRTRQRIEAVLNWAKVAGYRAGENPARWSGHLSELLPAPGKIVTVKHHEAVPWREMPAFMAALRQREGIAARAVEFLILTAARSKEARLATWGEVEGDLWVLQPERTKSGRLHRVPLSGQAEALLADAPRFAGCPYIFPSPTGKGLTDAGLSAVLRRMEERENEQCPKSGDKAATGTAGRDLNHCPEKENPVATPRPTIHGFRSSFKDWARAQARWPDEVSELALGHVSTDATRAAYARDELLDLRREQIEAWADFLAAR